MVVYLLYVISPILIWGGFNIWYKVDINSVPDIKKKYIVICSSIIFLMVGLRSYEIGASDGLFYYSNWELMGQLSFGQLKMSLLAIDIEKGYLICVWLLSRVFKAPQFVFIFTGMLYAISIGRFVYKYCDNACLALIIFNSFGLFNFMVQGIRQGIAICICLFAIDYCINRKFLPFVLVVVLACSFHASAFVFIISYFIYGKELKLRWIALFGSIIFVASLFLDKAINLVNVIMNENYSLGQTENTEGGYITIIIYLVLLTMSFAFKPNDLAEAETRGGEIYGIGNKKFSFFFYLSTISFLMFLMRFSVATIAARMSYYFMIFFAAIIGTALKKLEFSSRTMVTLCIYCCFLFLAFHKAQYLAILPYQFFWQ